MCEKLERNSALIRFYNESTLDKTQKVLSTLLLYKIYGAGFDSWKVNILHSCSEEAI